MNDLWAVALGTAVAAAGTLLAGLRWLRVAQREHYLTTSSTRFAVRWWTLGPLNIGLVVVAVAAAATSGLWAVTAVASGAVAALGPLGLSIRGRTSRLVTTRRLRTMAAVWLILQAIVIVVGVLTGAAPTAAACGAVAVPVLVDLALALTAPWESHLAGRFVEQAAARLRTVQPTVVAITGSYGKTSTKHHVAHLLTGTRTVVATPASFNNRAGLARSVNENLAPGTEVFVAEMGTYGPGEIAELCRWCPPDVAVITAIGPVHLERFGSEDRIVEAKAEILEGAAVAVLNVDDERLAAVADRLEHSGARSRAGDPVRVIRCASVPDVRADVRVRRQGAEVTVEERGEFVGRGVPVPAGARPSNLACALAVALELGVPAAVAVERLAGLPSVSNRLVVARSPSGIEVLDDTYNANPAGAKAALEALAALDVPGRRVVVTPGMIELGHRQATENAVLGALAADTADELVVVGRTNRGALVRGWRSHDGNGPPRLARTREEAVAWVRTALGKGDAVLYENDLPDHYP